MRDGSADDVRAPAFARAWEQLDGAVEQRRLLLACWEGLCDGEGFGAEVEVDGDGQGRVVVSAMWPGVSLEDANEAARLFAVHLGGAFDAALLAAAERVSGVVETPDPEMHRMPFCRSQGELAALVADGGLRGLRPDQMRTIGPFLPCEPVDEEGDGVRRLRRLMSHLAAMLDEDREAGRPRVAVWAHSAAPEVLLEASGASVECESTGDGVLEQNRTVATFSFDDVPEPRFLASPNVAFDLIFNDHPLPADPADNAARRSAILIAAAREFIEGMERSVGDRAPLRSGPTSYADTVRPMPGSPWDPLDTGNVSAQAAFEAAAGTSDVSALAHHAQDGSITMLVQSEGQIFARPVPAALPLDLAVTQGTAAENASLGAASTWGLADFVMRGKRIRKGAATREVGDGTIVTGRRGLAIQVKSRSVAPRDAARETNWLIKNAVEGADQARGTVRTLRSGPVELTNQRDRAIKVDGTRIDWVGVVIIDHPSPPDVTVRETAANGGELPIVVLLRRDWDFLFDHLRSVSAVVDYIHRVSKQDPEAIGHESHRYYRLAQDDENATPDPAPAWMRNLNDVSVASRPLLPKSPASSSDTAGHTVFRSILEDVATAPFDRPEEERLQVLALLDRFSVSERADLGRLLLDHLDAVKAAEPGSTLWGFRRVLTENGRLQLAFGACTHLTGPHRDAFGQWAMLRHHQFAEAVSVPAPDEQATVAILLTPCHDGSRPWDTTMLALWGNQGLAKEDIESIGAIWDRDGSRRRNP